MSDVAQQNVIVKALSGQKAIYEQIRALAKQQSDFVATGDSEALMGVLGMRSRLIDQVTPLDLALQPFKGRWQEVLDGLDVGPRGVVAGLLKDVQQLLADILAQDEIDKASLVKQKEEVGAGLRKAVTGVALNRAYGMKPRAGSVIG